MRKAHISSLTMSPNRLRRLPLKAKTALFVVVPILLVGIALTIIFWLKQYDMMVQDFTSRGETLASVLARISRLQVMLSKKDELSALTDVVTADRSSDEDESRIVKYVKSVIILDADGNPLIQSGSFEEVSPEIIDQIKKSSKDREIIPYEALNTREQRIAISVPILASAVLKSSAAISRLVPEGIPSVPNIPPAPGGAPALPGAPASPDAPGGTAPLGAPEAPKLDDERVKEITRAGTVVVSVDKQIILSRAMDTLLTGVVISALVTLAAAGISLWLSAYTLKPLEQVASMLREIAKGEADLTKRIVVQSDDEVGDLARWFNEFVESIQNIIRLVTDTANRVVVTAEELGATSEEVTAGAQEIASAVHAIAKGVLNQQAGVKETSLIMEQMSRALHEVAGGARKASETSSQTRGIASVNRIDIESANQALLAISDFIRSSAESFSTLAESSKMIGAAADVIRHVARRTNLLSLNASIEAARASEEGKGFGVVAEEIGNLARQSAEETNQIDSKIRSLQRDVEAVVGEMKEGERQIRNVGDISARAGEALQRIIEAVEQVAVTVQEISASIQRQVEGTERLVKALDEIASVAEDVSASTEQVSAAAEQQNQSMERMSASAQDLSKMADDLQRLVHRFKI